MLQMLQINVTYWKALIYKGLWVLLQKFGVILTPNFPLAEGYPGSNRGLALIVLRVRTAALPLSYIPIKAWESDYRDFPDRHGINEQLRASEQTAPARTPRQYSGGVGKPSL